MIEYQTNATIWFVKTDESLTNKFVSGSEAKKAVAIALGVACVMFFIILLSQFTVTSILAMKKAGSYKEKNKKTIKEGAEKDDDPNEAPQMTQAERQRELYKEYGLLGI